MACELTRVIGDPGCLFKGTTGNSVTLKLTPTSGAKGLIHDATYDGTSIITGPTDQMTFTVKSGGNPLSVVYTFAGTGTAELHEVCEGNTLIDNAISDVNNGKLYMICGSSGAAALKAPAKKAAARKTAGRKGGRS